MEILWVDKLLALAILIWVILKTLVRIAPFGFYFPIAGSPQTWFSHPRAKYLEPHQETPTARVEELDPDSERLLLLQSLPFFNDDTDISSGYPGPGPQPLRGMSGFPAQQQAQARNATLASARLPNGKIGAMILDRCLFKRHTECKMLITEGE